MSGGIHARGLAASYAASRKWIQELNRREREVRLREALRVRPVYVDPLMACVPSGQWRWTRSCHLFMESPPTRAGIREWLMMLHDFAQQIGLRREWFQDRPDLPHYDLTESRRLEAVLKGAVELDRKRTVECMMRWRAIN